MEEGTCPHCKQTITSTWIRHVNDRERPTRCPHCGSEKLTIERRPDGYTKCCDCEKRWRTDGSIF